MTSNIQRGSIATILLLSALIMAPAMAAKVSKDQVKQTCSVAGGSYSEGSNYGRCEYSNGDSYTCNTDVDKCESCTGGKCTVSMTGPGKGIGAGPKVLAPNASPTSKPKAAIAPVPAKAKN